MTVSAPSITDDYLDGALRAFLALVLPAGVEVIRGQVNRVPNPQKSNFVVFWPQGRPRLGTNVHAIAEDGASETIMQPTQVDMRIDVHGPDAADNAQRITTLFRDEFGTENFLPGVSPLFADDAQQLAFTNDSQQYEERWMINAKLQIDPELTVSIETADSLGPVTITEVDTLPL